MISICVLLLILKFYNRPNVRGPSPAPAVRAARRNAFTSATSDEGESEASYTSIYPADLPPRSQAQARANAVRCRSLHNEVR